MPRLFERFHRASNVDDRRFAGLGQGLSLSRGIAEARSGRIWAVPNPGGGSTLSVSLQVEVQTSAAQAASGTVEH